MSDMIRDYGVPKSMYREKIRELDETIADLEQKLADQETLHAETIGLIFRNEVVPLTKEVAKLERQLEEASREALMLSAAFDGFDWPEVKMAMEIAELRRQIRDLKEESK